MAYSLFNVSGISGVAPGTNTLNIPVSTPIYGGNNILMGNPQGWVNIIVSGLVRKLPYY